MSVKLRAQNEPLSNRNPSGGKLMVIMEAKKSIPFGVRGRDWGFCMGRGVSVT